MIKKVTYPPDRRLEIITRAMFGQLSEGELKLLNILISFSTNNSITLTPDLSKQAVSAAGITYSSFGTSIHRLEKKGVISSSGKTKILHPIFNGFNELDGMLINFKPAAD